MSKFACLKNADRDMHETMTSLERDEEYLPTFKSCIKDNLNQLIAHRATLV